MGNQHIIELNGKRYDAATGKSVSIDPVNATSDKHKKPASIDGFARASRHGGVTNNHVPAHKTERSKTLMRRTVQKPGRITQAVTKKSQHIQPSSSAVAAHTPTKLPKVVQKSALIRRFSDMTSAKAADIRTTPAPASTSTNRLQAVASSTAVNLNPLEAGLAKADSHNQPRIQRPPVRLRLAKRLRVSPRNLSAASFVLAGLLIGAFFTYQNLPNLSMRLASARSGLDGSLPSYQPAGFGLNGGISYKPGQIEVAYSSRTDNRNYKIIQSNSSWNSETLAQNYEPLKQNSNYQTIPNKGKTVYVYEGSNATWVDGGIWYRVEGDSKLSSDQLLNLADSL